MAKGRIEKTVDFINRDIFELFMRALRHPQQTWRYLRERHRTQNHPGGLYLFARALLDCVLRFNPISIMLSAGVYAASHTLRFLRHPQRLERENQTKWRFVGIWSVVAPLLVYTNFEKPTHIASAFGLGGFYPAAIGTTIIALLTTLTTAAMFYLAKSYANDEAKQGSAENVKTFTLNNNSIEENNTNVVPSIKDFTSSKYLINAKPVLSDNYTTKRLMNDNDAADATICLLRHLASTRSYVKHLIQAGNITDLASLFPDKKQSLLAQEDDADSLSCIGRAEKWLSEVNKPALLAIYERIKTINELETHFESVSEPDKTFIDKLIPCFNDKTPNKLHDSAHFKGSDCGSNAGALKTTLDKNIKPLFGPFDKKQSMSL